VIVDALGAVYGAAATWRRRWYANRPERVRHLAHPVISIGNLRVGGTGKTPVTAHIARLLLEHGERPAILSRGYARQKASAGVTVVSDGVRIVADVAHAGDEPMLLARALPGVPVLVSRDRFLAGRHAETACGATVHLLDDGFQHVALAREVDLLLADEHDLEDRVLPAGRLREPIANASIADAVIAPGAGRYAPQVIAAKLGVLDAFGLTRSLGALVMLHEADEVPDTGTPLFGVAGIARPERFFADVRAAGLNLVGSLAFGDHHVFRDHDIARIIGAAQAAGAATIVTTEKDAVRLAGLDLRGMPFAAVPLDVQIEPADVFAAWLLARLVRARARSRELPS